MTDLKCPCCGTALPHPHDEDYPDGEFTGCPDCMEAEAACG